MDFYGQFAPAIHKYMFVKCMYYYSNNMSTQHIFVKKKKNVKVKATKKEYI